MTSGTNNSNYINSIVYKTLGVQTKEYFQGIVDLATYICASAEGYISLLDANGMLVRAVDQDIADHAGTETFIRQVNLPGRVYQINNPGLDYQFFGGVPLISREGVWVGALWVRDKEPKMLNEQQQHKFLLLADQVIAHLEADKHTQELTSDLTDQKRFNELFDASNEVHCITDTEGKIQYVNASVHELLGYSASELIDKTIWDFCVEGERERLLPSILAAISQGKDRFNMETRTLTKEGEVKWFEWSDVIKEDHWLVSGRDITIRKKVEQQARVLTLAVEKSTAGVFIRNVNNEVIWMNDAVADLTGYTFEELKGKAFSTLLVGKDTDMAVFDYAHTQINSRDSYKIEIKCYKKGGIPVWLFISNTPLFNELGEIEQYVGVAFDITDRKEAEARLIKTREDAINLSRAKENFLSIMSHEIRTPLNGIIGATRLLIEEEHLKHQVETLGILQFSANNLLTLINDVLDFTKIETGNMLLESEPFDPRSLVEKTVYSFNPKVTEQGIALTYEIDPQIPKFIYGDSTRLYQILVNLIGNAVKFTSKGYTKVKLDLETENAQEIVIRFEVQDTGIGIAAEKINLIFDAYVQAGADISRKYGGTGLGLAITKKLVQLHGSDIQVTSKLGEGTKFTFTIAFKKVEPSKVLDPANTSTHGNLSGHVLVVDDSPMNRIIAQRFLTKWNLTVDLAEDGLQALEKIESNDYDLVLMDIHMPLMDGFEAAKNIRSRPESKYKLLPIIALTGSVSSEHSVMINDLGLNGFILKPFDADTLYNKVKAVLS